MTCYSPTVVIAFLAIFSGNGGRSDSGFRSQGVAMASAASEYNSYNGELTFFDKDFDHHNQETRQYNHYNSEITDFEGNTVATNEDGDGLMYHTYGRPEPETEGAGDESITVEEEEDDLSATPSPTPSSSHPLANTPIPDRCLRKLAEDKDKKLPPDCELWLSKNPQFVRPTHSPTMKPTSGPTIWAEVSKVVVPFPIIDDVDDATSQTETETGEIYDFEGTLVQSTIPIDEPDNIAADNSSSSSNVTSIKVTYQLTPTDDTFLEVWRGEEALGSKDKLKIDATEGRVGGKNDEKETGGMPTKVILLKFGAAGIYDDIEKMKEEMQATSLDLTSATLSMYAITSSNFGGYITPTSSDDWDEESSTWDNYVKDRGGGGRDKDGQSLLPSEENPAIAQFGPAVQGKNVTADITTQAMKILCCTDDKVMSFIISTDSSDGVIYASKEHLSGQGPVLELEFVLTSDATTTTDILDVLTNDVTNATDPELSSDASPAVTASTLNPTMSPSHAPTLRPVELIPASFRPFKEGEDAGNKTLITDTEEDWIVDADSAAATTSFSTSVVSSSFRMTVTALDATRRQLLRASISHKISSRRQLTANAYQTFAEKEQPAIIEHLTRVYEDVLSIVPTSISVIEEDDLVVLNDTAIGGVLRESVFRVNATFDNPDVSSIALEDAAIILDQATTYSFIGPEKRAFIKIYKNTSEPIIEEPAEYDVTVMKEANSSFVPDGSSTNIDDQGDKDGSTDNSNSSFSFQSALIAAASIVVVASTAAATFLYRQRRGGESNGGGSHKRDGDSPRSLAETAAPSTPSPNVFMDRFKNKKKQFDYAEFDDDEADVENAYDAVISPLTATHDAYHQFAPVSGPVAASMQFIQQQPGTGNNVSNMKGINNIQYGGQNVSFDDSSVSDVSANLLSAKAKKQTKHVPDMNPAESLLLDTTMDSYNMEAMSAMENVRFEDVLDMTGRSAIPQVPSVDEVVADDGSLSTGAVPSELYTNLSIDSSLLQHSQDASTSSAKYGGHLFTLDMLRNKDSALLEMPPPPSDAASDSSYTSHSDADVDSIGEPKGVRANEARTQIESAPMRARDEQDAVSQSINNELSKVMQLLKNDSSSESLPPASDSVIGGATESHIGTVMEGAAKTNNAGAYEGLNIIVDADVSTDTSVDENDPLQQMNTALTDCMDILEKARSHHRNQAPPSSNSPYTNNAEEEEEEDADEANVSDTRQDLRDRKAVSAAVQRYEAATRKKNDAAEEEDESSSFVTQRLDE